MSSTDRGRSGRSSRSARGLVRRSPAGARAARAPRVAGRAADARRAAARAPGAVPREGVLLGLELSRPRRRGAVRVPAVSDVVYARGRRRWSRTASRSSARGRRWRSITRRSSPSSSEGAPAICARRTAPRSSRAMPVSTTGRCVTTSGTRCSRTVGKNFDRTGALGPVMVTPEELPPFATGLRIRCRLNCEVVQDSRTDRMLFSVPEVLVYLTSPSRCARGTSS